MRPLRHLSLTCLMTAALAVATLASPSPADAERPGGQIQSKAWAKLTGPVNCTMTGRTDDDRVGFNAGVETGALSSAGFTAIEPVTGSPSASAVSVTHTGGRVSTVGKRANKKWKQSRAFGYIDIEYQNTAESACGMTVNGSGGFITTVAVPDKGRLALAVDCKRCTQANYQVVKVGGRTLLDTVAAAGSTKRSVQVTPGRYLIKVSAQLTVHETDVAFADTDKFHANFTTSATWVKN